MYGELLDALESGATVVTANNRLARTLQHSFDRRQLQAGASAWNSPDVLTWSSWLKRLWAESRLRGGQARSAVLIDEATVQLLWQDSIATMEKDRVALPLAQYARAARGAWKQLHEWNALAAEEWTRAGLTTDQQAFLRWSGEYRRRCEANAWIDVEQLAAQLCQDIAAGLFDDLTAVHFTGFDEWSPARLSLRDALQKRSLEVRVVAPIREPKAGAATPFSCRCASPDAELLAAARWARKALEANPDALIGVVVPDLASRAGQVRRIFLDVFAPDWRVGGAPEQLPLNVSYGCPLAETPIVQTALRLFSLAAGRAAFNDFSLLLRSPWLSGAADESAERALLEIELRRQLRIDFGLGDALSLAQKKAPLFAALLTDLLDRSRDYQRRNAFEWAHYLSDFLQSAGWPGRENIDSETWQALKSWNDLLADFATSSEVLGEMSRAQALGCLTQLAQQRLFQPEGVADGVQVMGVLEAAGHEFDQLWITGMARELWPDNAHPDPFIPLDLQRRLGMPDSSASRVLAYTGVLTERLLSSAAEVGISWPAQIDGEELEATSLIAQMRPIDAPAAADFPLWNETAFANGQTERLDEDPPPPWRSKERVRGGVSVLNLQALSPLNAFIEKRLGAIEIRKPPVGIDAMQRGILTHKVLEDFYRAAPDRNAVMSMDAVERRQRLTASLESALQRLPGIRDAFMQKLAALEMQQQLARLNEFIELDCRRSDFSVSACELSEQVQIGPLELQFKLDRLDLLPDGSRLVIDYKTGKVNRQDWNPDRPHDLQLPLYVTTVVPDASAIAFAQISAHGISYAGVGVNHEDSDSALLGVRGPGAKRGQVRFQYPYTDEVIDSWEELRLIWSKLLTELAEQFAKGDFRFDPRNPDSARGQFAVLSRIYDDGLVGLEDVGE